MMNGWFMTTTPRALFLVMAVVALGCSETPTRPLNVPEHAKWAGAGPSPAWILCEFVTKEPRNEYDCRMFRSDGRAWVAGTFVYGSESLGNFKAWRSFRAESSSVGQQSTEGV